MGLENRLRRPFIHEVKVRGFEKAVQLLSELVADIEPIFESGVSLVVEERSPPSVEEQQELREAIERLSATWSREHPAT